MEPDPVLSDVRNDVLRKIGRNVVLFQELEAILKFLAVAQRSSTPVTQLREDRARRAATVGKRTLGQVHQLLQESMYSPAPAESSAPESIVEPWFTFAFRIEADADADADALEGSRKSLSVLIEERNELVHHLLIRWNLNDPESCSTLSAVLDEQRAKIVLEIERYRAYAKVIEDMGKELQAFLDSDDGKRHFDLAFLQQSRLVAVLASVGQRRHAGMGGHCYRSQATVCST